MWMCVRVSCSNRTQEQWYTDKFQSLGHLHLMEPTAESVLSKGARIPDSKGVGSWRARCYQSAQGEFMRRRKMRNTFHGNFTRFRLNEAMHSFHFSECHVVTIFKAMSRVIQCGDKPFGTLTQVNSISRTAHESAWLWWRRWKEFLLFQLTLSCLTQVALR